MNQLNLNKDGTVKIDGKLVHITGQTMIEDAVIKSSMIDSLSANKITSGTLDANKVTVSNLDAANITGLDTSFIQSKWNAINGRVQIDGNEIKLLRYRFDKKS
ncbi:gp58-like family protein, partial [Escherichia coli]|nr:gp58-like family protein [Escherichia coli]